MLEIAAKPEKMSGGIGRESKVRFETDTAAYELGLWLSGLFDFLILPEKVFADASVISKDFNHLPGFRLTHSALEHCSNLCFSLQTPANSEKAVISEDELSDLAGVIREALIINASLVTNEKLGFGEWKAWRSMLKTTLKRSRGFFKIIKYSESAGQRYMPVLMKRIENSTKISAADKTELKLIIPKFASIVRTLDQIKQMMRTDLPLKPSVVLFSSVASRMEDAITHINNHLSRSHDEESLLFTSLDAASYTASIELKKVLGQELNNIVSVRSTPSLYARIETAYSLLNDSIQFILAGFIRIFEPKVKTSDVFDSFQVKLEESLRLRQHLYDILKIVKKAEKSPTEELVSQLRAELEVFGKETIGYLFYKDRETVERFTEEILLARNSKDLVPILHRFGAYVETLFGLICMRLVLSDYPFTED